MQPVGQSSVFFFYSAAYLTGQIETTTTVDGTALDDPIKNDTNLTAISIGLGVQAGSGITLMVGYRADFSGEDEGEERIHGIMATMAYTIR